jgi:hypothetical protein
LPRHRELLNTLIVIDDLRMRLSIAMGALDELVYQDLLDDGADLDLLQQLWAKFLVAGGVTADDLRKWLRGESIRHGKPVRVKRHVRLVENYTGLPRPRLLRRRPKNDDGDAA